MTFTVRYEAFGITRLPITKNFTCTHCGAKFYTTKWFKTKKVIAPTALVAAIAHGVRGVNPLFNFMLTSHPARELTNS